MNDSGPGSGGSGPVSAADVSCPDCPHGSGPAAQTPRPCPFVPRRCERGEILCLAGQPADQVWFVKGGVVGLGHLHDEGDQPDDIHVVRLAGSYVGLECLVGDSYLRSARALSRVTLCGATRESFRSWLRENDERLATVMRAVLEELLPADPSPGGSPDRPGARHHRPGMG
jgi:Cyclic nucleotide-binding domain